MFPSRVLTGNDGCDRWSEQSVWDAVLLNVRIVVSTHQVLYEALCHGFVQLGGLALLVFDEAHHVFGKHPANKIMQSFYHPARKFNDSQVPRILGLTASPITTGRRVDDLRYVAWRFGRKRF